MIEAIKIFEEWCKRNDMELNKHKSAILVLKLDNKTHNVHKDSNIRGVHLKKEYKYLSIVFSDTARTTQFVADKKTVIVGIANQLKKLFRNSSVPLVRHLATKQLATAKGAAALFILYPMCE